MARRSTLPAFCDHEPLGLSTSPVYPCLKTVLPMAFAQFFCWSLLLLCMFSLLSFFFPDWYEQYCPISIPCPFLCLSFVLLVKAGFAVYLCLAVVCFRVCEPFAIDKCFLSHCIFPNTYPRLHSIHQRLSKLVLYCHFWVTYYSVCACLSTCNSAERLILAKIAILNQTIDLISCLREIEGQNWGLWMSRMCSKKPGWEIPLMTLEILE